MVDSVPRDVSATADGALGTQPSVPELARSDTARASAAPLDDDDDDEQYEPFLSLSSTTSFVRGLP